MAEAMGRPELLDKPDYKRTSSEWLDIFNAAGVPCGPVNSVAVVARDAQVADRNMIVAAAAIEAEAGAEWAILDCLVPAAGIERFTNELAEHMTIKARLVLATVKEQFRLLTRATPLPTNVFERIRGLWQRVFHCADDLEGINAFHETHKRVSTGK